MSAALYLKQSLYSLTSQELMQALHKYYESIFCDLSFNTTQKAYKCYECCILVNSEKYCAGFGRNEEEATLNAGKIALESIIDSGETDNLKKIFEREDKESELLKLLKSLDAAEFFEIFEKEKLSYEDLAKLNIESLKSFVPSGLALKIYSFFHPNSAEVSRLIEENEVFLI